MIASAETIRVRVVPLEAVAAETLAAWSQLVGDLQLNPSLAPGWLEVSVRSVAPAGTRLSLATVTSESGALLAVIPTYVRRVRAFGWPLSSLELGSNLVSYHAELISTADSSALIRALLSSNPGWGVLHVSNVCADSNMARELRRIAAELGTPLQVIPGERSPYLPIAGTWEQFVAGKSKSFRYKLQRRSQSITRDGGCELRWFGDDADPDRLLNDMLEIEARSWKATAELGIGARSGELEYYRLLLPYLRREHMLVANVLYRQGRAIAYALCCHHRGWIGNLKTSFDMEFDRLSPGGYVMEQAVRRAFELGAREFDFLGDAARHKLEWTSHVREHDSYFLFAPRLAPRWIGRAKILWSKWRQRTPTEKASDNPLSN